MKRGLKGLHFWSPVWCWASLVQRSSATAIALSAVGMAKVRRASK